MQLVCWLQRRRVPKRVRGIVGGLVHCVRIGNVQNVVRV